MSEENPRRPLFEVLGELLREEYFGNTNEQEDDENRDAS